ncbi:MAG: cysteine desulfurase [Elusimicrobia bacterium]|nr:cysteine desulfurase [Elusimicrobiota bacterium]
MMKFDVNKIREDFPILGRKVRGKNLVYFDNAATSQKPKAVLEALQRYYAQTNANVHRGIHALSQEATDQCEAVRAQTARFLHAPGPEQIIFTRNATEAINLVAYAWGRKFLKAGDEILLTGMEHHSNIVPWQILAQEKSAQLKFVPILEDGCLDLEALKTLLTPRTKLFAFTAANNAFGTINPVEELLGLAREQGALTLVDAAQWTPHLRTDVAAWDCDFLVFSAHKMLGPTGLGVLYGKKRLLEGMNPFLGGGDMIREVHLSHSTYNEIPYKFEAGTPHIGGIVAFGAALEYLSRLGWEAIDRHERGLTRYAMDALSQEKELRLYGPSRPERRGGILSFNLEGVHAHDVGTILDTEGVAVRAGHHCCQPLMRRFKTSGTVRASFYFYNTVDEVDVMLRAIRKVKEFFKVKVP